MLVLPVLDMDRHAYGRQTKMGRLLRADILKRGGARMGLSVDYDAILS